MDDEKLAAELLRDEGLRLHLYTCTAGKTSIGIGRNLTDRGISQAEAMYLLANDINETEADLRQSWPIFASLDDVRQRVILNMAFNLGIVKFLRFRKMMAAIAAKNYVAAAAEMRGSLWASQVGARADRLAEMMETGVSP
jgi:lysozyme